MRSGADAGADETNAQVSCPRPRPASARRHGQVDVVLDRTGAPSARSRIHAWDLVPPLRLGAKNVPGVPPTAPARPAPTTIPALQGAPRRASRCAGRRRSAAQSTAVPRRSGCRRCGRRSGARNPPRETVRVGPSSIPATCLWRAFSSMTKGRRRRSRGRCPVPHHPAADEAADAPTVGADNPWPRERRRA